MGCIGQMLIFTQWHTGAYATQRARVCVRAVSYMVQLVQGDQSFMVAKFVLKFHLYKKKQCKIIIITLKN